MPREASPSPSRDGGWASLAARYSERVRYGLWPSDSPEQLNGRASSCEREAAPKLVEARLARGVAKQDAFAHVVASAERLQSQEKVAGSSLEIREQNSAVVRSGIAARREPLARVKKQRDELRLIFLSDEPKDI